MFFKSSTFQKKFRKFVHNQEFEETLKQVRKSRNYFLNQNPVFNIYSY